MLTAVSTVSHFSKDYALTGILDNVPTKGARITMTLYRYNRSVFILALSIDLFQYTLRTGWSHVAGAARSEGYALIYLIYRYNQLK